MSDQEIVCAAVAEHGAEQVAKSVLEAYEIASDEMASLLVRIIEEGCSDER